MSHRGSSSTSISPKQAGPSRNVGELENSLQPFRCLECGSRFTRHENLKRHALLHRDSDQETKFPCFHCVKVFARRDLRKRHIKKQHPTAATDTGPSKPLTAVPATLQAPSEPLVVSNASEAIPASTSDLSFLLDQNAPYDPFPPPSSFESTLIPTPPAFTIESLLSSSSGVRGGEPRLENDIGGENNPFVSNFEPLENQSFPSALSYPPSIPSPTTSLVSISPEMIDAGVQAYFRYVSPYLPFIHQPTFDYKQTPEVLLMAILSISLQLADQSEEGLRLSTTCFHRGQTLLQDTESSEEPFDALDLSIIQAYILLETYAILCVGGSGTTYGLRMHAKSIELARRGGLTEPYPTQPSKTGSLDELWRQFIRAESHKRTLFALQMLDVFWYHILSLPRILSHLEIKHDLPCSEVMWSDPTAGEWAHRSMTNKGLTSGMRYLSAVRTVLAPNASLDLSAFDAHGSLMVILFLSSSVREVSGWSTMTGRVSLERFEALHSSLTVFEPLIHSYSNDHPMAVMMKATWHMAMLELLLWSPSHINGVVEGSLDAALAAATHLSISQSILSSPQVVASLDPHLHWYLSYLDRQSEPAREPPWVTIFAFKAALIAWQLVRAGEYESTLFLHIADTKSMYNWIRMVFERRINWAVGRLVLKSLRELDAAM